MESEPEREIAEAVHEVRAGNREAYATIVARFQVPLMTLCVAILHDRQAAEELAQDVFVRAYQRLDTFNVRRPMKPWLVKIAYRLALERWRERQRERSRMQVAATLIEPQDVPDPSARLFEEEDAGILWRAVHALPLSQRTAVVLYYRENLSVADVALAMGVSPGSVKTHLFRARAQIERELRDLGFHSEESA